MINIKTPREIELMRVAGEIVGDTHKYLIPYLKPGITTKEIDSLARDYIISRDAIPSCYNYGGYPGNICISVNEELIHGIPSPKRILKAGDIVSVDLGAYKDGFHSDTCATFPVGEISDEAKKLLEVTKASLYAAIDVAKVGARIGDISHTVQEYCESRGYGVVRKYVGHGVGRQLHEDPEVPNFGVPGHGARLVAGMTFAIEPMINIKGAGVKTLDDGWTVVTTSGSLSAHFEHTIAITSEGVVILTQP